MDISVGFDSRIIRMWFLLSLLVLVVCSGMMVLFF